ncbi:heavy-metal-associated domain-containing protein [Mycetocola zhadangensis]|jgi:copper chaperone|uniref:heavy-metal-associated domain-containing protein n=1 Tax=Mycetocola zhadangensis TaxID=1164595 RepID=UPI003A4D29EF
MCTPNPASDLGLVDANSSCSCSTHGHSSNPAAVISLAAKTEDFLVTGMTCSHCVASVTEELSLLPGVESVEVELNVGAPSRVTVASSATLDLDDVRTAIGEAGYELAGTER